MRILDKSMCFSRSARAMICCYKRKRGWQNLPIGDRKKNSFSLQKMSEEVFEGKSYFSVIVLVRLGEKIELQGSAEVFNQDGVELATCAAREFIEGFCQRARSMV